MIQYETRDNNYMQPNRYFCFRGHIVFFEKEAQWSRIKIAVFNYNDIGGKPDEFTVHFRGGTKKIIDNYVQVHKQPILVMGDIIIKADKVFFDGKIIELYKSMELMSEQNAVKVDSSKTNYERAF